MVTSTSTPGSMEMEVYAEWEGEGGRGRSQLWMLWGSEGALSPELPHTSANTFSLFKKCSSVCLIDQELQPIRNLLYQLCAPPPSFTSLTLTICLTISEGECKSIRRLWILISKRSQVLEPSPQGDLRTVWVKTLVGRRTGPLTRSCLSLEREIKSVQTGMIRD